MVTLTIKIITFKQKVFLESDYSLTDYKINYPINKENETRD